MKKNMPNEQTYLKISEWLEEYHSNADIQIKEKAKTHIVILMMPVVKYIARTIARRAYDPVEDLIQAGFVGLLKAIDKYQKEKNDNFRVYAGYFIIGEMKHYLRDKLNTIRVPRYIQELSIRIYNFTKNLTFEEMQYLTSDEVATALDVPTKSVDFALQVDRRHNIVSLEDVFKICENGLNYEELLAEKDYKDKSKYEDAKIIFNEVIEKLPPEEKVLIDMYYKQDMSQKEIAEALLLSKMKVSRKIKRAFELIATLVAESTLKNISETDIEDEQ